MSNGSERAPATKVRTVTETAVAGTPVAVLVTYGVQQLWPGAPVEVQLAAAALGIGLVGSALSALRDRGLGGWFTGA